MLAVASCGADRAACAANFVISWAKQSNQYSRASSSVFKSSVSGLYVCGSSNNEQTLLLSVIFNLQFSVVTKKLITETNVLNSKFNYVGGYFVATDNKERVNVCLREALITSETLNVLNGNEAYSKRYSLSYVRFAQLFFLLCFISATMCWFRFFFHYLLFIVFFFFVS